MQSVICVGSALTDELYFSKESVITGTSNPASVSKNIGGVLSNIVYHLSYLGVQIDYITVVGNDSDGKWIKDEFKKLNLNPENIHQVDDTTGKYVSFLNPDGSLHAAVCVDICEKYITPDFLNNKIKNLEQADIIVCDTNISPASIQWLINFAQNNNKLLIIEPVSVSKSKKLIGLNLNKVFMITPNEDELSSITGNSNQGIAEIQNYISEKEVKNIWLRKGAAGSIFINKTNAVSLVAEEIKITDSTGAGDAALAGWIAGYVNQFNELKCIQLGHCLAYEVLQLKGAVKHDITFSKLLDAHQKYYPNE